MSDANTVTGPFFCGAVELVVTGEPVAMGYCHCSSCREWSAGPVNSFVLWKPEDVKITAGADNLGSYTKNPMSVRKWCKSCGGHVLGDHPPLGLVDVYAPITPSFPFKAGVHLNYQEHVLAIKDGLTKLRDFPKEVGGSGEVMAE